MTKTKKVKGGFVAFLAACLLTVNVAPAMAGGEWGWLFPILYEAVKAIADDGGGQRIRCYSAASGGGAGFVECSSCEWKPNLAAIDNSKSKCQKN